MDGNLLQRTLLKVFPTSLAKSLVEILLLFIIGFLAVVIRTRVKLDFNLPGIHGIFVMMLFMAARVASNRKIASSISGLAASAYLLLSFATLKNPYLPLIYFLMGTGLDAMYMYSRQWNAIPRLALLVLIGGLTYMIIPVSRILIQLSTGFPYSALLKHGYLIPNLSHFIFGATGAFLGAGLIISFKSRNK
jgi:hypothetical protein